MVHLRWLLKLSTKDGFAAYLRDIGQYPLLTKDQEIILARQVQAWIAADAPDPRTTKRGERAYHKLINCNLRLVVSIAKKYTHKCNRIEIHDLVQEGNMGLAHGIKKFDPERGYALSTYVYWWIRQSITRFISTQDRIIRMPAHATEILNKLKAWSPRFEAAHGRKPTMEECADLVKLSPEKLQDYMDRSGDALSLDVTVRNVEDGVMLIDSIRSEEDVFDIVCAREMADKMDDLLVCLTDRQKFIVSGALGLESGEPTSFQAMGRELGLSRERVRTIYYDTLRRLRLRYSRQHGMGLDGAY